MINLNFEKSASLNAQERYDIIGMAMDAADDNGFVNSYVFERALYCYAAIMLYPERKDEISSIAANNPIEAWNILVEDNTLRDMVDEYGEILEVLAAEGEIWFKEYSEYVHSARGILEMVQEFTGNIVETGATRLTQTAQATGVSDLLEVADNWGMNRTLPTPEKNNIIHAESLFNLA